MRWAATLFVLFLFSADLLAQIPVTLRSKQRYALTKEVYAAGSFNGWNGKDPASKLSGPDSSGYFKGTVQMNAGYHYYTFNMMGGPYLPDQDNPLLAGRPLDGISTLVVSDPMVTYLLPKDGDTTALPEGSAIEAYFDFTNANAIIISSLQVKIDGVALSNPAQYYNVGEKRFRYVPPTWLSPGEHTVEVSVSSAAGTATRKSTFRRGPAAQILNPVTKYPMKNMVLFGRTNDATVTQIDVSLNGVHQTATVQNRRFSLPLTLQEGSNVVTVSARDQFGNQTTDSRQFIAETEFGPYIIVESSVADRRVNLSAIMPNGHSSSVVYSWSQRTDKSQPLALSSTSGSSTVATVPPAGGEWVVRVTGTDGQNRTSSAARLIVATETTVRVADIDERGSWVDRMIMYEIQPFSFSQQGDLNAITAGLDELVDLGINCIYLTPVFDSNDGTGYFNLDFFTVRPRLGTIADFKKLVNQAHSRGIRVILDLSVNHTNIEHPFFQDALALHSASPFADFFIWNGTPADNNYSFFGNFFSVPEFNTSNPLLSAYLQRVGKFWIEETDVDGYRADAASAIMVRNPQFWRDFRLQTKNIRPDLFLVIEAFPYPPSANYFQSRFDAAFDFDLRGFGYEDRNIITKFFNGTASLNDLDAVVRSQLPSNGLALRFSDMHDFDRFSRLYGVQRSILFNTLILTSKGIPFIWSGSEYGSTGAAYDYTPYQRVDNAGFRERVKKLVAARKKYLTNSAQMGRLTNSTPTTAYSYYSKSGDNLVIGVLNFTGGSVSTSVDFSALPLAPQTSYSFLDVLSETQNTISQAQLNQVSFTVPGWGAVVYHIDARTGVPTSVAASSLTAIPYKFELDQNYPNPFNPSTTVRFSVEKTGRAVVQVFDILGRELRTLYDSEVQAGVRHQVVFDAAGLGSGMYFLRLESGGKAAVQKALLLK